MDSETFLENVGEARENGYELVCAECGVGVADDCDIHDRGCSFYVSPVAANVRPECHTEPPK